MRYAKRYSIRDIRPRCIVTIVAEEGKRKMMNMNDVKCPDCGKIISFKNLMAYEPEEVEIIGIAYLFRCVSCDCTFIPDMRFSKKATKKQVKDLKEMLDKNMS